MKLKKIFSSIIFNIKYYIRNRFIPFTNSKDDFGNKYLVCLTTYIKRVDRVYLTIESLMQQSEKSQIVLFLCDDDIPENGLPKSLIRLEGRGLKIIFVEKNIRSFKKLSCLAGVVDYNNYEYVVTVDDDIFYPADFLAGFSQSVDGSNVYCYRGKVITFDYENKLLDYSEWPLANYTDHKESFWILPTGVSGVCYPVSSICSDFFDAESFMTICPTADDIWYKTCTLKQGLSSKLVKEESVHFTPVLYFEKDGLELLNVGQNKNTIQMAKALEYFSLNV